MSFAGNDSKLTPETIERLCEAMKLGATNKIAADYVGVTRDCLQKWLAEAKKSNDPYLKRFLTAFLQARAQAAMKSLKVINDAAGLPKGAMSWRAAAWILERRYRDSYSQRSEVELSANVSANVSVSDLRNALDDMSDEGLEALEALAALAEG